MHALSGLESRICLVTEVTVTTVFHPDLHIVGGCFVHCMLHCVARQSTAKRTDYGRGRAPMAVANLSTGKTAEDSAAQGAQARGGLRGFDRVNGNDLAGVRVHSGSSGERLSSRHAIDFVRRIVLRRWGDGVMVRHGTSRRHA